MDYQTRLFRDCELCGESLKDDNTGLFFKRYHPDCIRDKKRSEKRELYQVK